MIFSFSIIGSSNASSSLIAELSWLSLKPGKGTTGTDALFPLAFACISFCFKNLSNPRNFDIFSWLARTSSALKIILKANTITASFNVRCIQCLPTNHFIARHHAPGPRSNGSSESVPLSSSSFFNVWVWYKSKISLVIGTTSIGPS